MSILLCNRTTKSLGTSIFYQVGNSLLQNILVSTLRSELKYYPIWIYYDSTEIAQKE